MGHRERRSTQKNPQNHRQRTDRGREAAKPEKPKEDHTWRGRTRSAADGTLCW